MQSTSNLRIFVLGKGGREHALAWKLSQSPSVEHIFVIPGNGGTARGLHKVSNIDLPQSDDYDQLVSLAKHYKIGLVVVGSDFPVVRGIQGCFHKGSSSLTNCTTLTGPAGIPCFSPSKKAAEIEGSKIFAKDFMGRHNVPTARYQTFDKSTYHMAVEYVKAVCHRIVIKADGLAEGKGVVLPETKDEALEVLNDILNKDQFGPAGRSVVIEEFLEGQKISVSTLTDGCTHVTLSIGQDHKQAGDGNKGPNTGGMGVYAPVPFVSKALADQIDMTIVRRTLDGLRQEDRTFCGMLFTGIIVTSTGPVVLEYNARFGDPEAQSILPLLHADVDLAQVLLACVYRRLHDVKINFSKDLIACGVVIAAVGYPEVFRIGDEIQLNKMPEDCIVFHAGTRRNGDKLLTAGGRVLTIVGLGKSPLEAIKNAYTGVQAVKLIGMYYRIDIGQSCL